MKQAIVTKYLGPTNRRGARVKVTAYACSMTFPWNDALSKEENHRMAAVRFAVEHEWMGRNVIVGGTLPDGRCVFVLVERERFK